MQKATAKIQTEIDKNKSNQYIQVVGQFLLQHLAQHPADAQKINAEDKTIAKNLDAMRNEASKKKVGNCAVLTDQEGFAVVLKYFGINSAPVATTPAEPPEIRPIPPAKPSVDFDVSLNDFL